MISRKKILILIPIIIISFLGVYKYSKKRGNDKLEQLTLYISKENFNVISNKRDVALDLEILLTSKNDYQTANLEFNNEIHNAEIRLKGDFTDHLKYGDKWSFRVKLKKGATYKGMRKFSIQHPITRNYIYEWVFHKMQKELGLISLRYEFVNLSINVDGEINNLGIYAIEEAFDKRLIENNNRREGVIIKFDESKLWENRVKSRVEDVPEIPFEEMYNKSAIIGFSEDKLLADKNLKMQYHTAVLLLQKYRNNQLPSNEVFDLEKTAKYMSLLNLMGSEHSVIWHNIRFYYNPITSLLEPAGFDMLGGTELTHIINHHIIGKDSLLNFYNHKFLTQVSDKKFIENFLNKYGDEMYQIITELKTEFYDVGFDLGKIKHNQQFIKDNLERINNASIIVYNESNYGENETKYKSNFKDFDFVSVDSINNVINLKEGDWQLNKSLIIPKGFIVKATNGFTLNLVNGTEIISASPFILEGVKDEHIKFTSSDSTGDGLFLNDCESKSLLSFVDFINLSNPKNNDWSLTGAVTFYKSDVELNNVKFQDNRSEDALNVFDANLIMANCNFSNTFSDAFDGDFVEGIITKSFFNNIGNDAIDISGSKLTCNDITVANVSDKCISLGENSTLVGEKIHLRNSEIGITSKDLSTVKLDQLVIDSCKLAFTAFQKKSEFGGATINVTNAEIKNSSVVHLIDSKSELILNNKLVETTENVIKRMYGKEFGKSSK